MIVAEIFHEIPPDELHVVEFREIENVRFQKHGRGNVQLVTNVGEVVEKMRISQFFGVFVNELLFDFSFRNQFCPDLHAFIIQETREKVNGIKRKIFCFFFVYAFMLAESV